MEGSCGIRPNRGRQTPNPPRNEVLAELAACQHGVFALWQLPELGIRPSTVRSRVARRALHRVHPDVVSVGHPLLLTRAGRFMAAVLACGDGAALSHRSAACHRGLRADNRSTIDVTSPKSRGRGIDAISAHSGATLLPRDVEIVDGIPCTTLARTLLDLAEVVSRRSLERAIDRAEILRSLDMRPINDILARAHGRKGATTLRTLLSEMQLGSTTTRSELEERFLTICRAINRPPDGVNAWLPYPGGGGAEADFLWRGQRLIVEVDGRETHGTPQAFEHDRRRDQRLNLIGWRVVRFTWRQVEHEAATVAATLAALLER